MDICRSHFNDLSDEGSARNGNESIGSQEVLHSTEMKPYIKSIQHILKR